MPMLGHLQGDKLWDEFVEENLYDGLHFRDSIFPVIILHLTDRMMLGEHLDPSPENRLPFQEFIGTNCCYTCRKEGHKSHMCRANVYCYQCKSGKHNAGVCTSVILMCFSCGVRGHAR